MKTVFNNSELCHVWATQTQDHGRGSSLSFNPYSFGWNNDHYDGWTGSALKSYNTMIGAVFTRPDGRRLAILSRNTYSMTTAKHLSRAQSAVRHLDAIRYPIAEDRGLRAYDIESQTNFDRLVKAAHADAAQHMLKAEKRRSEARRLADFGEANGILAALATMADYFGFEYERPADFESLKAQVEASEAAAAALQEKQRQERIAAAAEKLARWIDGDLNVIAHFDVMKLRINGDDIETSQGARIPVADAVHAWPILRNWHKRGASVTAAMLGENKPLFGRYDFRHFADGVLQVGCHAIPYSELERMAVQLGLHGEHESTAA